MPSEAILEESVIAAAMDSADAMRRLPSTAATAATLRPPWLTAELLSGAVGGPAGSLRQWSMIDHPICEMSVSAVDCRV